jgi:hypothetical protein
MSEKNPLRRVFSFQNYDKKCLPFRLKHNTIFMDDRTALEEYDDAAE